MKPIKTFCILFMLVLSAFSGLVKAQSLEYLRDNLLTTNSPDLKKEEMEGSPYFYNDWAMGEARLSDGKTYKGLLLMYDEVKGQVMFKYAPKDTAMTFSNAPVEFTFTILSSDNIFNPHFLNGFKHVDGNDANTFYQVLYNGKTKLLKKTVKKVIQYKQYGSSVDYTRLEAKSYYYLAKDMTPVKIKTDKKSILAALDDQSGKLSEFITEHHLDTKDDTDLIKIVDFYNSIHKS